MQADRLAVIRNVGVLAVAVALGGVAPVRSDRPGYGLGPCPICGQPTRHRKSRDKRGAIGLTRNGLGWLCFQCGASGDAVSLAAAIVSGTTKPGRARWREVLEACATAGLCEPGSQSPIGPNARREPGTPPNAEVLALWDGCVSVVDSTEASLWLHSRGLDFARVADLDLARAIRGDVKVPRWAYRRGWPWPRSGHRLLVPLYDHRGQLVSLHARNVERGCAPANKAASPAGFEIRGLLMACPLARLWLAGALLANDAPAAECVAEVGLVIAEGLPDWLTWTSQFSDADELAPAVVGILSGSWSQEVADKVPRDCAVTIATHHDDQGNKYAAQIAATLQHRMRAGSVLVRRSRPRQRIET